MYKFINKTTGEVKTGVAKEFGEGYEMFELADGEMVRVENKEMDGSNLTSELYTVEFVKDETPSAPGTDAE